MKKLFFILAMVTLTVSISAQERLNIIPTRKIEVQVPTNAEVDAWQVHFKSLDEFAKAVMQADCQLLKSGESGKMYYLIFRYKNQLVTARVPKSGGEFRNGGLGVTDGIAESNVLVKYAMPVLVEAKIISQEEIKRDGHIWSGYWKLRQICGLAATIKPDYKGPLTVEVEGFNAGEDEKRSRVTETVDWN